MDLLDPWDPGYEDVSTLSLDEIYQELSRLDAFEQLISPKKEKNDQDDTNVEKDSDQAPAQDNPDKTRKNTALHDIDTRRLALRAGAMELSRAQIRPITIVDLPADILRQVLDYFQDPMIGRQAQIDWKSWPRGSQPEIARRTARETIRQVRLVCSLFNDLASPLLCPVLRVDIDQESLNGAVELCKRPRIAEGVHAIQVGLQYRPEELASDCARFKDHRKKQLYQLALSLDCDADSRFPGLDESDESDGSDESYDEEGQQIFLKLYQEARYNHYKIRSAWESYFKPGQSGGTKPEVNEYQEILVRGHDEYRKKHQEQLQLLTTGSFVTTLASCISQLPNTVALGFTDEMKPLYDRDDPTLVLRDKSVLLGTMSSALEWKAIEDFKDIKLTPARILSELPIAMDKAGTRPRDLYIGPFPCRGSFSLICPDTVSNPTDPAVWSGLRAACSSLRRVSFGMSLNHRFMRHEHLRPEDKYYVDQYLSAILCSADLEDVWMNFYALGLNDGRTTKEGWYDLGPVLGAVNWPRIKHTTILDVSSKQDELERFCSGLSHSVQLLQLSTIQLLNGSWAGILSTLDEKVVSTFREQSVSVSLGYLTGGEFGEAEVKENALSIFDDLDSDSDEGERLPAAGQLLKELYPLFFDGW